MEIRTEGVSLLLDKLEMIDEEQRLEKNEIDRILDHPDIKLWLKAYDWIEDREDKFKEILIGLSEETSYENKVEEQKIEDLWEKKIDYGLRKAIEDTEKMLSSLETIKNFDWESTVQKALEYLPDDTELDPELVVTIDGFNGGMFRYDTAFLSLVYFDTSLISEGTFAHELHHMGADYWWKKDPRIQQFQNTEDKQKYYLVNLFTYLVGEGIANAFCSPQAITEIEGKDSEKHNQMVRYYEGKREYIFDKLEELLRRVLVYPVEDVSDLYSEFTMDKENKGIPPGHFLSGKMVQTMDRSSSVSQDEIINLIKNPFEFLEVYNKAAEESGTRKFSKELIGEVEDLLERS